jgi:hypothetical protein
MFSVERWFGASGWSEVVGYSRQKHSGSEVIRRVDGLSVFCGVAYEVDPFVRPVGTSEM